MNDKTQQKIARVKELRRLGTKIQDVQQILKREFGRGMTHKRINQITEESEKQVDASQVAERKTIVKIPEQINTEGKSCGYEDVCMRNYEKFGNLTCFNSPFILNGARCERREALHNG